MFRIKFLKQKVDFSGKTLFMPSLCTQAPTIALDHIIASNNFQKIAIIQPPFELVNPSIGYLPKAVAGSESVLGLPLQIYLLDEIIILQLRSTVRFGRGKQFVGQLYNLFYTWNLSQVLIVGILRAGNRPDLQIQAINKSLYYLHSSNKKDEIDKTSIISVIRQNNMIPLESLKDEDEQIGQILEGAGLANRTFKMHSKDSKYFDRFPISWMFVFGNDIDAKQSGLYLSQKLRQTIGSKIKQISSKIIENIE